MASIIRSARSTLMNRMKISPQQSILGYKKLEQFDDGNEKFKGLVGSQTAKFSTKIGVVIRSFDSPVLDKNFWGLPPTTRKIRLPESRVLYTVLRSPHIDKKSREQFQMTIKKQFLVINAERHELRKKFFWLKRQRIFGAQYEVIFSCKTRLDKGKLEGLLIGASSSKTAAIGS